MIVDEAAILEEIKRLLAVPEPPPQVQPRRNPFRAGRPAWQVYPRHRTIRRELGNSAASSSDASLAEKGFSFYIDQGRPADIRGLYRGRSVFLICGGPSLGGVDLSVLKQPGIVTMAINNAAKVFRPHLWIHGDAPDHFLKSIWYDPAILKFCPLNLRGSRVWDSVKGRWDPRTTRECPNTVFYPLGGTSDANSFLTGNSASWGDGGGRMTFVAALRVLYELGFRRVFLLGVDFNMDVNHKYAFDQDRSKNSINGNNRSYKSVNERMIKTRPIMEEAGFRIFNLNPQSRLTAFETMDLKRAVALALDEFDNIDVGSEPTAGLYDTVKSKLSPRVWGTPIPPGHPRIFSHSHHAGDFIYALPAVRALGGGTVHIVSGKGRGISTEIAHSLKTLFEIQPYITDVTIGNDIRGVDVGRWKDRPRTGPLNIAETTLGSFGLDGKLSGKAWLTADRIVADAPPVIIHRSPRYRNDKMPWKAIVEKYKGQIAMVGNVREHQEFCRTWDTEVPYIKTETYLDLARLIAGSRLFIGNQSSPLAVAEGMKVRIVQEVSPKIPNCIFNRDGVTLIRTGDEKLPELSDLIRPLSQTAGRDDVEAESIKNAVQDCALNHFPIGRQT